MVAIEENHYLDLFKKKQLRNINTIKICKQIVDFIEGNGFQCPLLIISD